jgi:hypothetical protein
VERGEACCGDVLSASYAINCIGIAPRTNIEEEEEEEEYLVSHKYYFLLLHTLFGVKKILLIQIKCRLASVDLKKGGGFIHKQFLLSSLLRRRVYS